MMATPYSWEAMNLYNACHAPMMVQCEDVYLTRYFEKYLLQRVMGVFKFEFPDNWADNYCLYSLFVGGNLTVFNTDLFGYMGLWGNPYGIGIQYQPTMMTVSNHMLKQIYNLVIGKDCEVLYFQPDWSGIMDIVSYYAQLMAMTSQSIAVNIFNTKVGFVYFADDKADAQSWKMAYDKIASGEPMVCINKRQMYDKATGKPKWEMVSRDAKNQYLVTDMLQDLRQIVNMFDSDIGLNNANTEKRERMLVDEVNANNDETKCLVETWMERMEKRIDKIKKLFPGIKLSVDWRFKDEEGLSGYMRNVPLSGGLVRGGGVPGGNR